MELIYWAWRPRNSEKKKKEKGELKFGENHNTIELEKKWTEKEKIQKVFKLSSNLH